MQLLILALSVSLLSNVSIVSSLISVAVSPSILFPADEYILYATEFTHVSFQCNATGIPAPNITWYRNGTFFDKSAIPRVSLNGSYTNQINCNIKLVTAMLTIYNATDGDSGNYTCSASNEVGQSTSTFTLYIKGN